MSNKTRIIHLIIGPVLFAIGSVLLKGALSPTGAQAFGVLLWMVYWWATRPVDLTVTAFLPIITNGLFNMVPMGDVTSQYASGSIILIFGSCLLTIPWATTGLDKRVALKVLSLVGPSMKSQITVWLFASMLFSSCLPNVAVCALFTPIAVAMIHAAGYEDIRKAAPAVPILLCVGWGAGLGGVGTPLGGAMNVAAISFFQEWSGHEFMYFDWVIRILPYFILAGVVTLLIMFAMFTRKGEALEGTKDYFNKAYAELGPMSADEKICGSLFIFAMIGAFTRPLFADYLPGLEPAYIFAILGSLSFIITSRTDKEKKPLLTWPHAQQNMLWGMMLLFGGGLALGKLINGSGAGEGLAQVITNFNLTSDIAIIVVFAIFAIVISELTSSTVSAAVTIPIILTLCTNLGKNPVPYWFICVMAYNAEFLLPVSVRAITVGYGLDANQQMKRGIPVVIARFVIVVVLGYALLKFWPMFGQLSYL
ncbi:MAG: SLC13 family permease [Eubacteriales bacterium]|nr:SLC13 family permease [Eubacteriales bacterium]